MAISVTCPECEHSFSVRDEYAGKRGKCPKCGGVFRAEAAEPAIGVGMPAVLAARSGVSLGKSGSTNGGFALDTAAPAPVPAPAGKKAGGGKKRKAAHGGGTPMPLGAWIALAVIALAGFSGGGFIYMSRGSEAVKIAENVDDGSEAKKIEQDLRDRIKELEGEIAGLKTSLESAEKSIGTKPKEKTPLGEIEKRIIPGVVKIIPYINDQPQQATATGFFVNDKQLVATSYQACEGATKLAIKLPTGTEYEIEGIVAADEKQGIVILKPKSEMPGVQPLKFAESPTLSRGDTVYAIGNPGKQEFTTSRGTITRVITQDQYVTEKPMFDVEFTRGSSVSTSFIEHDARIFPGDYGGPLLNENLDVIGMNQLLVTMVMNDGRTIVQTFGAAEEIKHIKALADKATATIIPYPPARPKKSPSGKPEEKKGEEEKPKDGEAKPGEDPDAPKDGEGDDDEGKPAAGDLAGKIDALHKECDAFGWKPKSKEQFAKLCEVSGRITDALLLDDGDDEKEAAGEAVKKVVTSLGEAKWEAGDIELVNTFAAAAKPTEDAGICFVGKVLGAGNFNGSPSLIFHIEGTESAAIVPSEKVNEVPKDTRGIVLGKFASESRPGLKNPDGGSEYSGIIVQSKMLVPLE